MRVREDLAEKGRERGRPESGEVSELGCESAVQWVFHLPLQSQYARSPPCPAPWQADSVD